MDDIAVGGMGAGGGSTGGLVVDEGAGQDDFSSLSTSQKLTHSNWKARKEGLDEVAADAGAHRDAFFGALPKLVKESNPSCLEAFFDSVISVFGVINDTEVSSLEGDVLKVLVEKGIVGRPKAVTSCERILKGLFAMPNASHAAAVQTRLTAAITHRTPKNRQAAATAFAAIVETFGPMKFNLKQLMKDILPLFSDQNAAVRKETLNFAVQVYRHIGPGINPFISELRDVQQAELQKLFESAQPAAAPGGGGGGGSGGDDGGDNANSGGGGAGSGAGKAGSSGSYILPNPPTDGQMFLNSPDTALRMHKELLGTALDRSAKWQDRNKAAQDLLKPLQSAYRLRSEDYTDLTKFLRDFLNDPQVPLNTTAFKSIQDLARVLREGLSPFARHLIPAVFDKFKDKKTPVIEHVYTTLGAMLSYRCCTFEQLQDEIDSAMASKIPHHRVAIITWLNLIVPLLPPASVKARLARAQHLPKLLTDEKTEVKDGTLMLIGKMMAACGDGAVSPALVNSLDAKQMAKVRLGMESAGGGGGGSGPNNNSSNNNTNSHAAAESPGRGPPSRRPTGVSAADAAIAGGGAKSPRFDRQQQVASSSSVGIASSLYGETLPLPAHSNHAAAAPPSRTGIPRRATNAGHSSGHGGFDYGDPGSFEGQMPSKMEAYSGVAAALGQESECMGGLASKEWAKRQAAVAAIEAHARANWGPNDCARVFDCLVIQFQSDPSFKESIFQVNTAVISCLLHVARTANAVAPRAAFVLIHHLGPKLSDPKCRGPMKELLTALAEAVGPRFVLKYLTAMMGSLNQPRLTAEGIDWAIRALFEFERSPIDSRVITRYCKAHCFEGQAAPVKAAAVQLLVALRQRNGPAEVDPQLADVNTHLRATITTESAKGVPEPSDVTLRTVKPTAGEEPLAEDNCGMRFIGAGAAASGGGGGGGGGGHPLLSPTPSNLTLGGGPSPFTSATSPMSNAGGHVTSPARTRSAAHLKNGPPTGASSSAVAGNQSPSSVASRRPSALPPNGGNVSARGSASSVAESATMDNAIGPDGDASHLMAPLIKEIVNGTDWKNRLNAVKKVENILKPVGRTLNSTVASDLLRALRTRFDEVNKNLIVDVLRTMNVVVDAAGPSECRAGMRAVLPHVLNFLGDQKTQLREEATYFSQVAFHTLGAEHILPFVAKPLGNEAQFARLSIVGLLESVFEQYVQAQEQSPTPPPPLGARHVATLVPPLLRLLMDRLGDVRIGAEHVLIYVIHIAGAEVVNRAVLDLRQADRAQVKAIVERCIQQVALSSPEGDREGIDDDEAEGDDGGYGNEDDAYRGDDVVGSGRRAGDYDDTDNSVALSGTTNLYADPHSPMGVPQRHHMHHQAPPPQHRAGLGGQRQQHQMANDESYLPAAALTISGSDPVVRGGGGGGGVSSYIQQHQQQMAAMGMGGQPTAGGVHVPPIMLNQQQQHMGFHQQAGAPRGPSASTVAGLPPQAMVRSPLPAAAAPLPAAVPTAAAVAPFSPSALSAPSLASRGPTPVHSPATTIPTPSGGGGHAANDGINSPLGVDGILGALEGGADDSALGACSEFIRRFRSDPTSCVDNYIIASMCNRLRRTIGSRSSDDLNVYLQQGMEAPPPPRTQPVNVPLAASLIECLTAIFGAPEALVGLEELTLTAVFNIIIDSIMSEPPDSLVRGLNNFALGVVMRSPPDVAYRALILCLADYTLPYLTISNQTNHKYMTLILKCLMRLDVSRLSPSVLVSASHDYLVVHPPSQFRTKDDLAIRTIKTKIQTMCGLHGHGLLRLAEEECGPSSIVVHLVRAALEAARASTAGTPSASSLVSSSFVGGAAAVGPTASSLSVGGGGAAPTPSQSAVASARSYADPNTGVSSARSAAASAANGRVSPAVSASAASMGVGASQRSLHTGGASPSSIQRNISPSRQSLQGQQQQGQPQVASRIAAGMGARAVSPQNAAGRSRASSFVGGAAARPGGVSPHRGGAAAAPSASVAAGRRSTSPYSTASPGAARTVSPGASGFRQQQGGGISPSRLQQQQQQRPADAAGLSRGGGFSHHASAPAGAAASSNYSAAERAHMSGQLAEIFSMARKPEETAQGLQRMYAFIKSGAADDAVIRQRFEKHFAECSEPFRNYLGKRLNAARVSDGAAGAAVRMPHIITETLVAQGLA